MSSHPDHPKRDTVNEKWEKAVEKAIHKKEGNKAILAPWRMLEHLYLGNSMNAKSSPSIRELGITHVVNLAADDIETPVFYDVRNVKTLKISAKDDVNYNMIQHHEEVFQYIEQARKEGGRVLIHCVAGVNRSGLMCMTYMLDYLQEPLMKVLNIVLEKRGAFLSNPAFRKQLVEFARERDLLNPSHKRKHKRSVDKML